MNSLINLEKLKELGDLKFNQNKEEEKRKLEEKFRKYEETVNQYVELIKIDNELINYLESIIVAEISKGFYTATCSPKNLQKYTNIHAFKDALNLCCPDIEFSVISEIVSNNHYNDYSNSERYTITMSWD